MFQDYKYTSLPSWTKNCIAYQIYPLGFCDCPTINPIAKVNPRISQIQPVNRLSRIRQYYSYFQELGINTIILGPVFESCTHGYDVIDYFNIDRRLGTNKLFGEIVRELHQQNIKVIIDVAFSHTGRLFPTFIDIKKKLNQSKFIDWYKKINFSQDTIWKDGFSYEYWKGIVELPSLNCENPEVKKYIFNISQFWLRKYNIDGWRLDSAYTQTPEFWQQFRLVCKDINPECLLLGELIDEDYNQWVNPKIFDTATNYQLHQHLYQAFNQHDLWQLEEIINCQKNQKTGKYKNLVLTNFAGNHDTRRIYNQIYNIKHLKQVFNLLFSLPGIPCLYYGDEILINGDKHPVHDHNLRQPMPNPKKIEKLQQNFLKHIQSLTSIRRKFPDITNGIINILYTDQKLLILEIKTKNNQFINIINLHPGLKPKTIFINNDIIENNSILEDLFFPDRKYKYKDNYLEIPKHGTILKILSSSGNNHS